MTAFPCSNSMSLVERKKQQWAREREELANLGVQFKRSQYSGSVDKGSVDRYRFRAHQQMQKITEKTCRLRYGSKQSLVEDYEARERRSSLPPLYKNQYNSNYDYPPPKADRGGETSGYGSDSFPTPEYKPLPSTGEGQWTGRQQQPSGYESSSSYRDDRPKWGKSWPPKEQPYKSEPPNWVKRGLEAEGAIVVGNSSPSVSPEQRGEENDRPCTGSSFSQHRSYIRGQNVHIDSEELAEREQRRQQALAHQDAIRKQLEERELRRQEERARRIREEHEEELRIEREQECERQRKLEEERVREEKLERDRKRKEAIKQALELAEKEAKLEKMRLKMQKQSTILEANITENVIEKVKVCDDRKTPPGTSRVQAENQLNNQRDVVAVPPRENISKEINNNLSPEQRSNSRSLTPRLHSPRNNSNNFTPRPEQQFAYVFQPSLEGLQNIQYAVLIPTAQYSIAVAPPSERTVPNSARTENRILTPTRYRNNAPKCDSSTQTDSTMFNSARSSDGGDTHEKYLREKMSNLELSYENKRRVRRSRSETMDDRPKWGVNRPPTRYMKQSEKDPVYQKRKLKRESANEKNSSDDSRTGTPIRHRKKDLNAKRRSRARWRTEERLFSGTDNTYHSELVRIETDKDQLYLKCCCTCRCPRHSRSSSGQVDILRIEENNQWDPPSGPHGTRRERGHSLPEFHTHPPSSDQNADILSKLSSLHNGLLLEQEKWENSPRTPN
uniref:CCDC66 domain-containing protein n=1 Tax=Dendroctonus ponderosae TaxID=77166 RepID=A0AAR5Q0W5_DENPD